MPEIASRRIGGRGLQASAGTPAHWTLPAADLHADQYPDRKSEVYGDECQKQMQDVIRSWPNGENFLLAVFAVLPFLLFSHGTRSRG
jgi:hypothetical protein